MLQNFFIKDKNLLFLLVHKHLISFIGATNKMLIFYYKINFIINLENYNVEIS